jgi:uncharacterized protein YkwD
MAGARVATVAACISLFALAWAQSASAGAPDWRWCPNWDLQPTAQNIRETVIATYCVLNAERMQYGLPALRWNWRLWWGAQQMAGDMVARHFFSHTAPGGRGLADRIGPTGYLPAGDRWALGENLGWGQGRLSTPVAIVAGWMMSQGHRANILGDDYREIGIAAVPGSPVDGRTGGTVFVAEFGRAGVVGKTSKLRRRR